MGRYQRNTLVIDVIEIDAPGNYGILGNLTTQDFIFQTLAGTMGTLDDTGILKYSKVPDSTPLIGSDNLL